ncbi:MAG: hypothetical protein AVDCRST_MAG54-2310, partial [uncultured Actinomycetospora sp.]
MGAAPPSSVSSLLDEQGSPARRWADLGVVRASELTGLTGRRGGRRAAVPRDPGLDPGPVATPEPEPPPPVDREGSPVLPVAGALAGLLPDGGLRRGSTVAVCGSTSLLLALLAEASRAGSWC